MAEENWERDVLAKLAEDVVAERRRTRRWGNFWRFVAVALVLLVCVSLFAASGLGHKVCLDKCTAVVRIDGEIDRGERANAEAVVDSLKQAFEYPKVAGVLVVINSPGGSPVQAGQIHDELKRLRAKHPDKPAHAVVEDMAASGGYYIAAAADRIYVDKASIVGSIGVIMSGFGFTGAIDKLGVERRVIAAGKNKAFLDPFQPQKPEDVAHIGKMLNEVHEQFIGVVRDGRGARLKESPDLYSGLVWTGARAIELGLADALGSAHSVARDVIQAPELVDFTPDENLADRLSRRLGTALAQWSGIGLRSPRLR
ncbi:MAG: S49 family peptidase [Betaproteobacteria bacterium]|jgi:protease-4|nr:S49 family peptidase [Betaproteobacteria bacterium]